MAEGLTVLVRLKPAPLQNEIKEDTFTPSLSLLKLARKWHI